jgi:RNA polymerase sigma-70 factor (family 1)
MLFQQLAEGDEKAFEQIYHHYNQRLAAYITRMTGDREQAAELIQNIFVKVWVSRELLASVQHPTSYLFNVAANATLNYLKKAARSEHLMSQLAYRGTEISNETEELVDFNESAALVAEAVAGLSGQRREIYELSRNQGLSNEEIAEHLGLSGQTVKNNLVLALKHIRTFMESRGGLFSFAVYFLLTRK